MFYKHFYMIYNFIILFLNLQNVVKKYLVIFKMTFSTLLITFNIDEITIFFPLNVLFFHHNIL